MEESAFPIFEEIFDSLDNVLKFDQNNGDIDSLRAIGAILAMPEDKYEVIKPVLLDSIERTFNEPDTQFAFLQMINANGLSIEDFETNEENFITAINALANEDNEFEIELSDSKKDFLKCIYAIFINTLNQSKGISHRVIQIPIELCRKNAKLPTYATNGSAAMDLYSTEEYIIKPGETVTIPVGIKVDIPRGYALLIQPRSGMSLKSKIRIPNSPGLIDSDYHDEIKVIVENIDAPIKEANIITTTDGTIENANLYGSSYTIGKGERFAQMRLVEVPAINWLEVNSIGEFQSDHGEGFGSTGTN